MSKYLSAAQLAEGRRLLADVDANADYMPSPRTMLGIWLAKHAAALLDTADETVKLRAALHLGEKHK